MRILLVEDSDVSAKLIGYMLEKHIVTRANTGNKALELFNKDIDLVLLDIGLPDIDGFEVAKRIRQISNVPIIATTAYVIYANKDKCLEAGINDMINKPVTVSELKQKMNDVLKEEIGHGSSSV